MNKEKIDKLFNNVYVEINTNHDEAVNVYNKYLQKNSKVPVLVNFDSHSDLSVNNKLYRISIANWVNFCIKKFDIDEFYWVIPEHIIRAVNKKMFVITSKKIEETNFFCFENMETNPLKNNFGHVYYSKKTNEIRNEKNFEYINKKCDKYGISPILDEKDWKKVKVTILTEDELGELNNKKILLSVDADYFCNSGFDTTLKLNNVDITKDNLLNKFDNFIDKLEENNIDIACCSLTYSPIYFPSKFKKEIENFYQEIKTASKVDEVVEN